MSLEVLFTPAEFGGLSAWDLTRTWCVVFDVLRATSTMVTALAHGAQAIIPAGDIPEALAWRTRRPDALLAGERNGVRILANLTQGIDFDLGNSPREFTPERVRGRTIIMTTTNGTRALRACTGARAVLVGSFLNLGAVTAAVRRTQPSQVLIVCSGTLEQASFEDTLAAGALCDALWPVYGSDEVADSVHLAREVYRRHAADLGGAMRLARNGRRLLALPDLREDVALCVELDRYALVPTLDPTGFVRWLR